MNSASGIRTVTMECTNCKYGSAWPISQPSCCGLSRHVRMFYLWQAEIILLTGSGWEASEQGVLTMTQRDRDRLWHSGRREAHSAASGTAGIAPGR